MKLFTNRNNLIAYLLLVSFFIISCCIFLLKTKAGLSDGDSMKHFLFSKYAPQQPLLYFNHGGKPFFTLIASFFSQFGFIGIKFMNLLLAILTAYMTYQFTLVQKQKNAYISIIFTLTSTFFFLKIHTGLTEYLSAAMLISSVFLASKKNYNVAATIISLTPFVRSEGLILIGVFAFYFLLNKKFKPLIFLTIGHILYSTIGYFWYEDILWVFTKIPYAHISSRYGIGNYSHFVFQMMYILGIPIYLFLILGLIKYCLTFFTSPNIYNYFKSTYSLLIVGLSLVFFCSAHSILGFRHFSFNGLE